MAHLLLCYWATETFYDEAYCLISLAHIVNIWRIIVTRFVVCRCPESSHAVNGNVLRRRQVQPMTNGLDLLAHWSVRQKLNRVSSVQLRRSVRVLPFSAGAVASPAWIHVTMPVWIGLHANYYYTVLLLQLQLQLQLCVGRTSRVSRTRGMRCSVWSLVRDSCSSECNRDNDSPCTAAEKQNRNKTISYWW